MYCIYKITNIINNKIYIGQTNDPKYRWYQHQSYAKGNKPQQYIHHAIAKYGIENFTFEVIDFGLNHWHIDCLEVNYIKKYDSKNPEKGYNLKSGGSRGAHSENTRKKMSEATIRQIQEKGHPSLGKKRSDEAKANMSAAQKSLNKKAIYTPEIRQRMSEAHIGLKDSEETKKRKSESIKLSWEQRHQELIKSGELKCNAPGCEVNGVACYLIVNGIRYCSKHGQKLKTSGTLEKLPKSKYSADNPMPEEIRKKCGAANIGRIAHNRHYFESEQINYILNSEKSIKALSREFKVTEKVIKRVKSGKY